MQKSITSFFSAPSSGSSSGGVKKVGGTSSPKKRQNKEQVKQVQAAKDDAAGSPASSKASKRKAEERRSHSPPPSRSTLSPSRSTLSPSRSTLSSSPLSPSPSPSSKSPLVTSGTSTSAGNGSKAGVHSRERETSSAKRKMEASDEEEEEHEDDFDEEVRHQTRKSRKLRRLTKGSKSKRKSRDSDDDDHDGNDDDEDDDVFGRGGAREIITPNPSAMEVDSNEVDSNGAATASKDSRNGEDAAAEAPSKCSMSSPGSAEGSKGERSKPRADCEDVKGDGEVGRVKVNKGGKLRNRREGDGEGANQQAKGEAGAAAASEAQECEKEDDAGDDPDPDTDPDPDPEEEKTVAGALMAGAKRSAASGTVSRSAAKGGKGSAVVMEKTDDLLAKATWKKGQPVPFQAITDVFHRVEETTKRLEIQEILRGFLCMVISLTPEDLVPCIYLACNEVAPAYERLELGIGDAVLQRAIQGATGRSAKDVKSAAQKAGDLGEVAQHSTKAQGTLSFGQTIKSLSARQVLEAYRGIARVKGSLSQEDKINRIKKMLVSCKGLQAKYIIRGLQGKMRIGLSVPTVMVSLSHAAITCPSEAVLDAEAEEEKQRKMATKEYSKKSSGSSPMTKKTPHGAENQENGGNSKDEDKDEDEDEDEEEDGSRDKAEEKVDARSKGGEDEDEDLIPMAKDLRAAKDLDEKLDLATQLVKQAFSECPNLDLLIKALLTSPLYRLQQHCRLRPGVPVSPMLAKPTKSIGEVLQRLSGQEFTCEYKYDGVRAQVHLLPDGSLKFFSRNSKDSSSELPDLIPVMKECAQEGLESYVLDTEVVAYDRDTGNLLPFQMLSTRGRKEVDAAEVKVKVIVEAFDILYLNGKSLLQESLLERRKALKESFKEVEGRFRFATYMDHKENGDTGPIEEFLAEAVKGNCEGLMVKTLTVNASYEPSRRSLNWLKLKKDYLQADGGGVGDSLDLVPIGAFLGRGKRTGKYGAYLLACYDPEREEYQSVCKIGTGFTDEILNAFWTELKEHTVEARPKYYNVADTLEPDVWLAPHKVWEVKCADLSKSPVHKAAIGKIEADRGISIRFPRLLRERNDKDPDQATTSDQILDMYESQDVIKNNLTGSRPGTADDDWEL